MLTPEPEWRTERGQKRGVASGGALMAVTTGRVVLDYAAGGHSDDAGHRLREPGLSCRAPPTRLAVRRWHPCRARGECGPGDSTRSGGPGWGADASPPARENESISKLAPDPTQ